MDVEIYEICVYKIIKTIAITTCKFDVCILLPQRRNKKFQRVLEN